MIKPTINSNNSKRFSICVKNIDMSFSKEDLENIFKETGIDKIKDMRIFGKCKYGFVEFEDYEIYKYWIEMKTKVLLIYSFIIIFFFFFFYIII
jgi:RNA recognition motif-containing protein